MAGGPTPFGDDDEAFTEDSVNSDVLSGSGFLPTANASPGALPAGWALNEYRIESLLGGGGFGLTYLAHDTLLDCKVAIKEFLPTDIAVRGEGQRVMPRAGPAVDMFEQGLRRFLDESRALATFRHPNIVRVSRFFEANGSAYMVMDYVQGRTLNQWVRERNDAIDRATLLAIVKPLLEGLQVVHDGGFLHRDIKPANICIRDDGTPVLLDFGAARRYHDTEHTLTAIVTPGFAPFEQYHSHGNQGPWTDIYSLAAVMYWLVTGQRPVESAARVHNDPLLPAAKAADAGTFGASLLRAIDWALEPHETRRPRSVADFRRVFMPVPAARGPLASGTPANAAPVRASGASEERRTIVCSVLYAQIDNSVDLDTAQRLACKSELDDALARAARSVDADSRLIHDTEDGAALCLLGQPEDACVVAQRLRTLDLGAEGGGLRQGINLGPVRVTRAGTGALDVHGDGLDAARTLAGLARAGQVLVSRAYFETVSALGSGAPVGLHTTGQRAEIASRSQEVFELDARSGITRRIDDAQPGLAPDGLTPLLEALLARHIGPMARVLVSRIAPQVSSTALLIEQLATHIPGEAQRAGFLIEARRHLAGSTGVSSAARSGALDTVSASRRSAPLTTTSRSSAFGPRPLDDALIADIEHRLARRIGPMARILVGRALKRVGTEQALLEELARDIPDPVQRAAFLAGK